MRVHFVLTALLLSLGLAGCSSENNYDEVDQKATSLWKPVLDEYGIQEIDLECMPKGSNADDSSLGFYKMTKNGNTTSGESPYCYSDMRIENHPDKVTVYIDKSFDESEQDMDTYVNILSATFSIIMQADFKHENTNKKLKQQLLGEYLIEEEGN